MVPFWYYEEPGRIGIRSTHLGINLELEDEILNGGHLAVECLIRVLIEPSDAQLTMLAKLTRRLRERSKINLGINHSFRVDTHSFVFQRIF